MRAKILAQQLMNGCQYCKLNVNEDGDAFFNCSSEISSEHFNEVGFDDVCTKADETDCPFAKEVISSLSASKNDKGKLGW